MSGEKKVRVRIRTIRSTYTGDLFIPPMRNRFSDVVNEPEQFFVNLTDVEEEGRPDKMEHLSINKFLIETITDLAPGTDE